jgi:enoyl-CoA hydratase
MAQQNVEQVVLYEKHEAGFAQITFNRPHRLNAVIEQLYQDTLSALDEADADKSIRTVVLTGAGRAFCVGADLKEHAKGERTVFDKRAYLILGNEMCKRIYHLRKPVIAAVNGYALGGGAEMAVASDFILMAESAQIGFPETSIGTFIGGGVSHILPHIVGLAKARELIYFGDRIDGREAAAIGLATRCFPDASFMSQVHAFAAKLVTKAPVSLRLAKQHLNSGARRDVETALAFELDSVLACMATRDWQEGVDAFVQKRAPVFKGE